MFFALSAFSTLPCALSASLASVARRARYALADRRLLPPPHPARSAKANIHITPAKRLRQRMAKAYVLNADNRRADMARKPSRGRALLGPARKAHLGRISTESRHGSAQPKPDCRRRVRLRLRRSHDDSSA